MDEGDDPLAINESESSLNIKIEKDSDEELELEENYKISVKDILTKVTARTKIVFLANPNNPTGTYLNKKEIKYLRKKLRSNILLVIDDAYFEYMKVKDYDSGLKLFSKLKLFC